MATTPAPTRKRNAESQSVGDDSISEDVSRHRRELPQQTPAPRVFRPTLPLTLPTAYAALPKEVVLFEILPHFNPWKHRDSMYVFDLVALLDDKDREFIRDRYFTQQWGFAKSIDERKAWGRINREMSVGRMKDQVRRAHPVIDGRRVYPPAKVAIDSLETKEEILLAYPELTCVPDKVYMTAVAGAHVLRLVEAGDVGEDFELVIGEYLFWACRAGLELPVIRWLADRCGTDDIDNAVRGAAAGGHIDALDLLVSEFDAGLDFDPRKSQEILYSAVAGGHHAMIDHFVEEYPYEFEDDGSDLLCSAAVNGRTQTIDYLVEKLGAVELFYIGQSYDRDALRGAEENGYAECAAVILDYMAEEVRQLIAGDSRRSFHDPMLMYAIRAHFDLRDIEWIARRYRENAEEVDEFVVAEAVEEAGRAGRIDVFDLLRGEFQEDVNLDLAFASAARFGHIGMIDQLVEAYGADECGLGGRSHLPWILRSVETAKHLVEKYDVKVFDLAIDMESYAGCAECAAALRRYMSAETMRAIDAGELVGQAGDRFSYSCCLKWACRAGLDVSVVIWLARKSDFMGQHEAPDMYEATRSSVKLDRIDLLDAVISNIGADVRVDWRHDAALCAQDAVVRAEAEGRLEIVKHLVENHVDLFALNRAGRLLIDTNTNSGSRRSYSRIPNGVNQKEFVAVLRGYMSAEVRQRVESGEVAGDRVGKYLKWACRAGLEVSVVEWLARRSDYEGATQDIHVATRLAAQRGHIDSLDALINNVPVGGARLIPIGIHAAALSGNVQTVTHLVEKYDVDLFAKDASGCIPIEDAEHTCRDGECAATLRGYMDEQVRQRVEAGDVVGDRAITYLKWACRRGLGVSVVGRLARKSDFKGSAEIYSATRSVVASGHFDRLDALISNIGADVREERDWRRDAAACARDALFWAIHGDKVEIVKGLLDKFDVNVTEGLPGDPFDDGSRAMSPLELAIDKGRTECAAALRDYASNASRPSTN